MIFFFKFEFNRALSHGKLTCVFTSFVARLGFVFFPMRGNVSGKRIVGIRRRKQSLDGQKHSANLKRRRPLVSQNIKANAAKLVHIRVIDLCEKANLGRRHWVLARQEQLQFENTACERTKKKKEKKEKATNKSNKKINKLAEKKNVEKSSQSIPE
jgi:hypothetical protein